MSSLPLPFRRFLLTVAVVAALAPRAMAAGHTTLISIDSSGAQGMGNSEIPAISADGRFVAFRSRAYLTPDDINGQTDIFVHDRHRGKTTRVSVSSSGTQANGFSIIYPGGISGDGRIVAFGSDATNLVKGDTNGQGDAFMHDRLTKKTRRVSVASNGTQGNSGSGSPVVSADGRAVAFPSTASNLVRGDTNDVEDAFVHDLATHQTTRVSRASNGQQGNGPSYGPDMSGDGRFVAFASDADNLVPGDTNGAMDIFVHDRTTHDTFLVSVTSSGVQANGASEKPTLSADGRFVAFLSLADNLVKGDTNGMHDIFVHDRATQRTTRVSVASSGTQANYRSDYSAISADGRFVAFESFADNLVLGDISGWDLFVRDRQLVPDQTADLVVRQTASADPVGTGDALTYTVTVHNQGPDPADHVSLIDLVPHNAHLLSVSPSQGRCSQAPVSVCHLGRLAAGESATVEVRLTATHTGVLRNTAFCNAAPIDPEAGNNSRTLPRRWNDRDDKRVDPCMQAERITLGCTGAARLEGNDPGEVVVHMGRAEVRMHRPVVCHVVQVLHHQEGKRQGGVLPRRTNGTLRSYTPDEKE